MRYESKPGHGLGYISLYTNQDGLPTQYGAVYPNVLSRLRNSLIKRSYKRLLYSDVLANQGEGPEQDQG